LTAHFKKYGVTVRLWFCRTTKMKPMEYVRFTTAGWDALPSVSRAKRLIGSDGSILSAKERNEATAFAGNGETDRSVESQLTLKSLRMQKCGISSELKVVIDVAYKNITTFHEKPKKRR
jgi:hypothetical protein